MLHSNRLKTVFLAIFCAILQAYSAPLDTLYYLNSDFELASDQSKWEVSVPGDSPDSEWEFGDEGGRGANYPQRAYSGSKNALFQKAGLIEPNVATLVSPLIDLSRAKKPELAFAYAQIGSGSPDKILMLFQAGLSADWDTIYPYTNTTNQLINDGWVKEVYNIDEVDEKYLCDNFRIAFMGFSKSFSGMCIDSVVISEKDTVPKFVRKLNYTPVEHSVIPAGAMQLPIVHAQVEVIGNSGDSKLNSISFKLDEGQDSFFGASGFKLFHTKDAVFENKSDTGSNQIGTDVSISGGVVTFSGLNRDLYLGNNSLWLTADIANGLPHNSYFEFAAIAESFSFNDTLLPVIKMDSIGAGYTRETVFYDNFSTDKGWILSGDFERAAPMGFIANNSEDPTHAYSGNEVLGTDLTGDGLYTSGITTGSEYYAYTPEFNLKYYDKVYISMQKWIDVFTSDTSKMEVTNDGGATWHTLWISTYHDQLAKWYWREQFFSTETDDLLSRQERVQFRIGMTHTVTEKMGVHLDNFAITGNHLDTDVGITEVFSPFDDCIGFNNDTVKIRVRNFAEGSSPNRIPVYYALWGLDSTVVRDTIEMSIAQNDSIIFKFSELADFKRGDIYDKFIVGVDLAGDEDAGNNTYAKTLYIQDTEIPPALADFEYRGGVWRPSKGSDWRYLRPEGDVPQLAGSDTSWIFSPYGEYKINETRYLRSSCYDLTHENNYIVEFKYWYQTEAGHDGFAIEYSENDGQTWQFVDTTVYGRNWGWCTDSVEALGHIGWSGDLTPDTEWHSAKELLPSLINPKVKFRVKWAADTNLVIGGGMAIDNFRLYPAPPDMGVSSIAKPEDACQFVNTDTVEVYVKNYGVNSLKINDTIIVGLDFELEAPVFDTFRLSSNVPSGDSVLLKVPTSIDIDNPGSYSLRAYTLSEKDPHFYGTSNDTTTKTITIWGNPITNMLDSIFSRQPDTVVIRPYYNAAYSYLWFDAKTDPTHTVTVSDMFYSVTVTESTHGCVTKDSTYVQLLFNDVGISEIVSPISTCELTNSENVTVNLKNMGTDSLLAGEKIFVYYTVDGGTEFSGSVTLAQNLRRGEVVPHTFADKYDFTAEKSYTIKAYSQYGGDTVRTNDTTINTITVFGYTPFDLGPDRTVAALTTTLDAGAGFVDYRWSNLDSTRTTLIDSSGKYWIDVTDANGCSGSDTISIFLKIHDVKAYLLFKPVNYCDRAGPERVELLIQNSGSDTIKTTDNVTASYTFNDGTPVTEPVTLTADLLPNGTYSHVFSPTIDLSAYRTYKFNLEATVTGDMRPANDTFTKVIATYETPSVNLGGDRTINGDQVTLDAGFGVSYTYLWQDSSTNQTYNANVDGKYYVRVTNSGNGCFASDTANLEFDVTDFKVEEINIPELACQIDYRDVEVTLINNGTVDPTNTALSVSIQVDDGTPIVQEFIHDGAWAPKSAWVLKFDKEVSLKSKLGNADLKVAIIGANDLTPENDLLVRNLNVRRAPQVDFGGDTIQVPLPHTLNAFSPDATNYIWNDNSTLPQLRVTIEAKYSVIVFSSNGCETQESVFVERASYLNERALENLDLSIRPNPVEDFLNVTAKLKTGDDFIIEMYDISNKIVFSEEHNSYSTYEQRIDVSKLSQGVYFLRIRNDDIYFVDRVIVK